MKLQHKVGRSRLPDCYKPIALVFALFADDPDGKKCRPGIRTVSQYVGKTRATVFRGVKFLRDHGVLIEERPGGGRKRATHYRFIGEALKQWTVDRNSVNSETVSKPINETVKRDENETVSTETVSLVRLGSGNGLKNDTGNGLKNDTGNSSAGETLQQEDHNQLDNQEDQTTRKTDNLAGGLSSTSSPTSSDYVFRLGLDYPGLEEEIDRALSPKRRRKTAKKGGRT